VVSIQPKTTCYDKYKCRRHMVSFASSICLRDCDCTVVFCILHHSFGVEYLTGKPTITRYPIKMVLGISELFLNRFWAA